MMQTAVAVRRLLRLFDLLARPATAGIFPIAALSLAFLPPVLSAQTSPTDSTIATEQAAEPIQQEQVVRDPQAATLLQKVWSMMGGATWNAAGMLQMSGTLDTFRGKPQNGTFTLSVDPSGNVSADMTDDEGKTSSYVMNGSSLKVSLPGQAPAALPLHKQLNLPPYFLLGTLNSALNSTSWSIIPHGTSTVNGAACTDIEIRHVYLPSADKYQILSQFTERHLFVDLTTGLIDRITYKSYSNSNIRIYRERIVDYAEYQHFGPYLLPSSITDSANDGVMLHMSVTSATPQ